ncbi:hypothetical protein [Haloarcula sp. H-GB5]|jgi:hypothetical protein
MSQSQPEQVDPTESDISDVQTGPINIGSDFDFDSRCGSDVKRISDKSERNDGVFRPIYTALGEDIEVELITRINQENSPYKNGHLVITRPNWDEPREAPPQNIRIETEADLQ